MSDFDFYNILSAKADRAYRLACGFLRTLRNYKASALAWSVYADCCWLLGMVPKECL